MYNSALDHLTDYPFDRLRRLLDEISPPTTLPPLVMSLGEPQHAPPTFINEIISNHSREWGKYPPVYGPMDLLTVICGWLQKRYNLPKTFLSPNSNVLAVSGTKEALFMMGDLAIPEKKFGQRPAVLIPNPFYQVYIGAAVIRNAEPIFLSANKQNGFLPDFDSVDDSILNKTSLVFLCSPTNPQGAVASKTYLANAVRLARKYNFILAVDECYSEIYDNVQPPGVLEVCSEIGDGMKNILCFHSLSKRSSVPGLRSGFVAGDQNLIEKLKTLRNYGGASTPLPLAAAAAALWEDEEHVKKNRLLYSQKFDIADEILSNNFDYYRPPGGFYLWLNVGDGINATKLLWQKAGVKVIPGTYLAKTDNYDYNPGLEYIRVALVHEYKYIKTGLNRLKETLS